MTPPIVDKQLFRQVLGRFATGVTVVTVSSASEAHGMTCSAFMSVSDTPPMIAVSLTTGTRTERMIEECGVFGVNILASDQMHVADRFAGRHKEMNDDRFRDLTWAPSGLGAPLLDGVQAWLECRVAQAVSAGDHTILIGAVEAAVIDPAREPLVYFASAWAGLALAGVNS